MSPIGNLSYLTEDHSCQSDVSNRQAKKCAMMPLPHPGAIEGDRSAVLIQRSAWKGNSPNSVNNKFGEFRTAPVRYLRAPDAHGREG